MKSRSPVLLAVLGLAVAGWVAWRTLRPGDRIYGGKPLSAWIDLLDNLSPGSDPPPVWGNLTPDESVVVLIKALEMRGNRFNEFYRAAHAKMWPRLPVSILKRLPKPLNTEDIGINALLLLDGMGPEARAAIPTVIHTLSSDRSRVLRHMAADCLSTLFREGSGPSTELKNLAIKALVNARRDPDPLVRTTAANALRSIDREAAAARSEMKRRNLVL